MNFKHPNHYYITSCSHCGILLDNHVLHNNEVAECPRCQHVLSYSDTNLEVALVSVLASLALFFPAYFLPLLSLQMGTNTVEMSMVSSIVYLISSPSWLLGLLISVFLVVLPLLRLLGLAVVLTSSRNRNIPIIPKSWIRFIFNSSPWSMPEVYLLGFLVTLSKLFGIASVDLSIGVIALVITVLLNSLTQYTAPSKRVWYHLKYFCYKQPFISITKDESLVTACLHCGNSVALDSKTSSCKCDTCDCNVSYRINDSLGRTWALVLTSIILFIPANILPITTTTQLGKETTDTIMSNIFILWDYKSYFIAIVIFLASIVTPLIKIIILIYLLISVKYFPSTSKKRSAKLFHLTERVGRWSMIDVFVVAILGTLIQMGMLATIMPASGIIAFCAVVVMTMLAAHSFDPRMIWDSPIKTKSIK